MPHSEQPSPSAALELLEEGNRRFITGVRSVEPLLSHLKMQELAEIGQRPFAVVLTCSDSRSPAELIFDQGLGDLFVVRVAGNVVAPSLLASIEFATSNFGSPIVLVLGHTKCGAVSATIEHKKEPHVLLPSIHLEELIGRIMPAIEATQRKCAMDTPGFTDKAVIENIRRSCRIIVEQSMIVRDLVATGKLSVQGAILDINTGIVRFLKDESFKSSSDKA